MTEAVFGVRRDNLRLYVRDKYDGNRAAYSRAAGVNQNQVNLLLTKNERNRRNLGEALARKMEKVLGEVDGYFDVRRDEVAFFQIKDWDVPQSLHHIFRRETNVARVAYYDPYLAQLAGKLSAKENLALCEVSTADMQPDIAMGEHVIVDTGVTAVRADGIYVLVRGGDFFLRRVTKRLSGHWLIEATNPMHEPT